MDSSRLLFFILHIMLDLVSPATAQIDDGVCTSTAESCWRCSSIGNYTNGSSYQENLNNLLSSFSSNTAINYGFYNSSLGQDPNKVNAIALCRGDVTLDVCHTCITQSSQLLFQNCSYQKEAILWAERCMVRYSSKLIFGIEEDELIKYLPSPHDAPNWPQFEPLLNSLLDNLREKAASGDSLKKYAAGHALQADSTYPPIYALVQCNPDMDTTNCSNCLQDAISKITGCCFGKSGARVLKPSCFVRFEDNLFYDATADSEVSLKGSKGNKSWIVIIVVVSIGASLISIFICFVRKTKKKLERKLVPGEDEEIQSSEALQFDFDTIRDATDNFSEANKLGEGGFGSVYKGTLENEQEIAVKRLSKSSGQGVREFKNEVLLVVRLQHRNLVKLLGFCLEGEETILVYEYVPNKSLDYFLFEAKKREQLDWSRRCTIIGGISRGILYLHEDSRLRVIHRDLKASNVLLDANMNPKISDFGMARMFGLDDQTQGNTRRIVGTYGYMAPEYAMEGLYSIKSDVFSFGILLLEIVMGRKNFLGFHATTYAPTLLSYAWQLWNEGKALELMDPLLKDSCSSNELLRYIHIGLLCVQEDANDRPTMSSVVHMLKSESMSLSKPERPAFYTGRKTTNDHSNTLGSPISCSVNVLTISDHVPR